MRNIQLQSLNIKGIMFKFVCWVNLFYDMLRQPHILTCHNNQSKEKLYDRLYKEHHSSLRIILYAYNIQPLKSIHTTSKYIRPLNNFDFLEKAI